MHITYISIFPDVYTSFLETSLIHKAREKNIITYTLLDPRNFCEDKHHQIDDEIYGWWAGMLMKAKPVIDAVEKVVKDNNLSTNDTSRQVLFLSPSEKIFDQQLAQDLHTYKHIIFVCWRYEGIDYRFEEYMRKNYSHNFSKISAGKFITLGGEVPSMIMTEAIVRLIPGVIKEEESHLKESYSISDNMQNLEYPQYTRPEELLGMKVPDVLLSGHHAEIEKWKNNNTKKI